MTAPAASVPVPILRRDPMWKKENKMEFHEKLQNLRRQRGLTQEELAQALYVSRTAVSKWESGRGFPNIDSLKAIAAFFSVSVDELLSGDALLTMAETEGRQRASRIRGLVLGLLDCGMSLLLFLPLFGQRSGETVQAVSLFFLTAVQPYLKTAFLAAVILQVLLGILSLALQSGGSARWRTCQVRLSLGLNAAAAVLFVAAQQSYASVFALALLLVKALLLIKRP